MGFWNRFSRRYLSMDGEPSGKPGARAYAVGDIHGRLDLLDDILQQIKADIAKQPASETYVVFLGDLIDRGPDSRGVVQRLVELDIPGAKPVFLGGNHEQVLLDVLDGAPGVLHDWLRYGGEACVASYGLDAKQLGRMDEARGAEVIRSVMPGDHIAFLKGMGDTFRFGDYLFVHAGIRPGIAIEDQARQDLRWIREPFLGDSSDHGMVVVHGHTVMDEVDECANRIGIDTGAYKTGVLTALVVEGVQRRYLSAIAHTTSRTTEGAGSAQAR